MDLSNYIIPQNWRHYSDDQHAIWNLLFKRQLEILPNRVVGEFLDGLKQLKMSWERIPDFEDLSYELMNATGWQVVGVPSLVPDDIFFELLSQRKFPSTCFIRTPAQIDYLQEPDIFHDIFGHIPLLIQPVFADYMQAYGKAGLEAMQNGHLEMLARLYWYTVEFGLIETSKGLQIYGSGIVSSKSESIYCLESPNPQRIYFDRSRVMRTSYRIDDFQDVYFVIRSFEELLNALKGDLVATYKSLEDCPSYTPTDFCKEDKLCQLP